MKRLQNGKHILIHGKLKTCVIDLSVRSPDIIVCCPPHANRQPEGQNQGQYRSWVLDGLALVYAAHLEGWTSWAATDQMLPAILPILVQITR